MNPVSNAKVIERFHVAFLDALSRRADPRRYVLKGGANLRYFFDSLRYSEDLDLETVGGSPWNLEAQVDAVLESGAIQALLRSGGSEVAGYTKPEQTETTRRWEIAIAVAGHPEPVRTKVEFSSRNGDERYRLDPIPGRIVLPLGLRAPTVQHYIDHAPAEQKVRALAGRSETQARDVFDLELLLRRDPLPPGALDASLIDQAADRALDLPFAAFRDQVLPFLETDAVELFDTEDAWVGMQTFVAERLGEAR